MSLWNVKIALVIIIIGASIWVVTQVFGEESGRYQGILLPECCEKIECHQVFIMDTKEGHIWMWGQCSTIENVRQGSIVLQYQGKVRPKEKIGDVVEQKVFKETK